MRNFFKLVSLILCLFSLVSVYGCKQSKTASIPSSDTVSVEKDKKIVFASSRDPWLSREQSQLDVIKEKLGITVEFKLYHPSTIASDIASGVASNNAPDIYYVKGYLPSALAVLQPLENSGLDLACMENQAILNASKFSGKHYLYAGFDPDFFWSDVCVYNKALFEKAKAVTPDEFYKNDEWTLENFALSARKIAALGEEYIGAGLLDESSLSIAGESFFSFIDNRIGYSKSEKLVSVMEVLNTLYCEGTIKLDRTGFKNGKQGMALTNTFGLLKSGFFAGADFENIGITFMPKPNNKDDHIISAQLSGFGIVKGSKNINNAGAVIKELTSFDVFEEKGQDVFISEEAKEFYKKLCDKQKNNCFYYISSDVSESTNIGEAFHAKWGQIDSDKFKRYINDSYFTMSQMVDVANEIMCRR